MAKTTSNPTGILIVAFISLITVGLVGLVVTTTLNRPAVCPKDAKVCPNGTTVGRSGPRCEFAPCPNGETVPQTAELSGKYVCLKPKNPSETQTLECAFGLETGSGDAYALDTSLIDPKVVNSLKTGTEINVSGTIIPIEMLSTDKWTKYGLKGIVKVQNLKEK